MQEQWQQLLATSISLFVDDIYLQALAALVGFCFIGLLFDRVLALWLKFFSGKQQAANELPLLEYFRRPLFYSLILTGLASASLLLALAESVLSVIFSVLYTLAIIIWAQLLLKISKKTLQGFSSHPEKVKVLTPKTLPLFENIAFILIIVIAVYYIFINWHIDMTAWLASAGIVGIAVGFAAKDTLANLFSGVFIMADAPYKIGDFVVLDGGERGEITQIGIRSTRLLTRDDVEVTVPNSVMGNTKIINESGGRHEKFRIRVQVGVAYGSDIDKVRDILMQIGLDEETTCNSPEPRVRFRQFGPSSLDFELCCWIEQPVLRGRILDKLNTAVYKAFIKEGIEIPYAKQDLYIKEMPGSASSNR
ncbi:mechanosensitive ion channel family protein [Thalassomonas haliotis]|uniref:Small-conductance mechanosensitive channel n=1 Tax=Thalassomonas haliotis TaxID=485448 RepID=A0ABY7V977_9GAMM|nr:mechanosensitive ion channel family protein [Thalassomonas haliotis]WDE09443.1 mechanosensitive ion channel family protein [Thalassomonas haliotis]